MHSVEISENLQSQEVTNGLILLWFVENLKFKISRFSLTFRMHPLYFSCCKFELYIDENSCGTKPILNLAVIKSGLSFKLSDLINWSRFTCKTFYKRNN